jgi:tetratricopeptide (TPR) repeat protein
MISNYSDQAKSLLEEAIELSEHGKFCTASEKFKKALALENNNAKILSSFGTNLFKAKRYSEAIEQYLATVRSDPAFPFDIKNLSDALDRDSEQEKHIQEFQEVVDTKNSPDLFQRWGQVLVSISQHDLAIEQFKNVLLKNPGFNLDYDSLAKAIDGSKTQYYQMESFQTEMAQGQTPIPARNWGKILMALGGNYTVDAIKEFQEAIKIDIYWLLWHVLIQIGQYNQAFKNDEKEIEIQVAIIDTYCFLGRALIQIREYNQAIDNYEQAMEVMPSDFYLTPWQEAILQTPSQIDQTIIKYEQAMDSYYQTLDSSSLLKWGNCLHDLGKKKESAIQYARSLAIEQNLIALEKLQETLDKLKETLMELKLTDREVTISRINSIFQEANGPGRYILWGIILSEMEDYDTALKQLTCSLTLHINQGGLKYNVLPEHWQRLKKLIQSFPHGSRWQREAIQQIEKACCALDLSELWIHWCEILCELPIKSQAQRSYWMALLLVSNLSNDNFVTFANLLKKFNILSIIQKIQAEIEGNFYRNPPSPYNYKFIFRIVWTWSRILGKLDENDFAIQQCQKAIELRRNLAEDDADLGSYQRGYSKDLAAIYIDLGGLYFKQGKYNTAIKMFELAVKYHPDNALAVFELGKVMLKCGRQNEAIEKYLESIEIDSTQRPQILEKLQSIPELTWSDKIVERFQAAIDCKGKELNNNNEIDAQSYNQWGVLLYKQRRYEESIKNFQTSVNLDPDMGEYVNWKNWRKSIAKSGFSVKCIQDYEQAIEKYRKNADAYKEWGDIFNNQGLFEQARDRYQKTIEKDKKCSESHVSLLDSLSSLHDIEKVKQEAHRLLSYEPENWYAYYYLVWIANFEGKFDEAICQADLGFQKGINSADFYRVWAFALNGNGQSEEAIKKFDEVLQRDLPDQEKANLYFDYGNLLLEMKRYKDAESQFQSAIKLDQNHASSYHNIASISCDVQGRYKDAWSKWQEAIQAYGRQEPAIDRAVEKEEWVDSNEFFYHAHVLQSLQPENDEAENILQQGVAFNPQNTLILSGLTGLLWEKKGECLATEKSQQKSSYHWQAMEYFQQAERLLQQRLKRYENYADLIELGDLYFTIDNYVKANEYYEKACLKNEKAYLPLAKLGVIQIRLKKYDEAKTLLEKSLSINPDQLEVKSSLAESNLLAENLDEADKYYREIISIAPNHVQSLIGLGATCTAWGDKKEVDRYLEAIQFFNEALNIAKNEKIRSKYLTTQETAKVYYLLGYNYVQLYENSNSHRKNSVLNDALGAFKKCRELNPTYQKAIRSIDKLEKRLFILAPHRLTEFVGPITIFSLSLIVFFLAQYAFLIKPAIDKPTFSISDASFKSMIDQSPGEIKSELQKVEPLKGQTFTDTDIGNLVDPKNIEKVKSVVLKAATKKTSSSGIELGSYAGLTFGSLLFMVVGLYLPQVLKLSVAGISIEKTTVDQAQAGGKLGISK